MQDRAVIEVSACESNPDSSSICLSEAPAEALIGALKMAGLHVSPATWDAMATWVADVERRVAEMASVMSRAEAETLQLGYALERARSERDEARQAVLTAHHPDATTAALQRKVAEREAARAAEHQGPTAPAECCPKCKRELKVNGSWRSCTACSQSWRVSDRAQSLAVPDSEQGALGEQVFRDKGKPPVQTVSERMQEFEAEAERLRAEVATRDEQAAELRKQVRELQAHLSASTLTVEAVRRDLHMRDLDIENLRAANTLQAPSERSAAAQLVVMRLRDILSVTPNSFRNGEDALGHLYDCLEEIRETLRRRLSLGPTRIEFSVKEVLP